LWLNRAQTDSLKLAADTHSLHLNKIPCLNVIPQAMRKICKKPGDDYIKCMTVLLEPGEIIDWHEHQNHVVLYYPPKLSVDPVLELPNKSLKPEPGSFLYLPPNTPHRVPKHVDRRISVAMVIEK